MSRFNRAAIIPTVPNREQAPAYAVDERSELIGLIWTSFCADSFYSKWSASLNRLRGLVTKHPELASKAALLARRRFGLRSISHVVAALVAHEARGQQWLRPFLYNVVKRPDDMLEILAVRASLGLPKAVPHSMRRAFADRLTEQSAYSLAKYRGDDKTFSLRDAVFLCHPKPTEAIQELVAGTLKNTETWESLGNSAATWSKLLTEGKLGYLALLRNLRNIIAFSDPDLTRAAAKALVDPLAIQHSLTMPHQYVRALDALCGSGNLIPKLILEALSDATELSLDNLPRWSGTTVIGLDGSGSMRPSYDLQMGRKPGRDPWTTARTFAAALWKRCENPIFIPFTTAAEIITLPVAPTLTLQNLIDQKVATGGTNMSAVFDVLNRKSLTADRVILLTDEQSWIGSTGFQAFERWKQSTHSNPIVHSVDLESYGTCQFPSNRTNLIFGWNSHLFDILKALEEGSSKGLVDYVEKESLNAAA